MNKSHLYVLWKDNPPSKAMKVFRVVGNIDQEDGKCVFQIPDGGIVRIDAKQVIQIGISGDVDKSKYGVGN